MPFIKFYKKGACNSGLFTELGAGIVKVPALLFQKR